MRPRLPATLVGSILLVALAGCVEDMDEMDNIDAPLRTGSAAAEQGCVQGVNTNYGSSVARVTSSDFSQANTEVMLTAEGETWRCLVSETGDVRDLSVVG